MPEYAYECSNEECGFSFIIEKGMNEPDRKRCPKCRKKVNRVFESVGVIFRGAGFHVNDYPKTPRTRRNTETKVEKIPDPPVPEVTI